MPPAQGARRLAAPQQGWGGRRPPSLSLCPGSTAGPSTWTPAQPPTFSTCGGCHPYHVRPAQGRQREGAAATWGLSFWAWGLPWASTELSYSPWTRLGLLVPPRGTGGCTGNRVGVGEGRGASGAVASEAPREAGGLLSLAALDTYEKPPCAVPPPGAGTRRRNWLEQSSTPCPGQFPGAPLQAAGARLSCGLGPTVVAQCPRAHACCEGGRGGQGKARERPRAPAPRQAWLGCWGTGVPVASRQAALGPGPRPPLLQA